MIEFFSVDDLDNILKVIEREERKENTPSDLGKDPSPVARNDKEEDDLYSISNFSV